jgi:hypothetical protein
MVDYGMDFEETHENMHIHRRERHYSGHKLAVAVGHNKFLRAHGGESTKAKGKKVEGER